MKCEICGVDGIVLDSHHIKSKSKGGTNHKSNRCNICPNCHRRVHSGEIILEGRFLTTGCKETELVWHHNTDDSITGNEPDVFIMKERNE